MSIVDIVGAMDPFPQFLVVVATVGLFFTTVNYIMSRLTILVRGYPPPHCCVGGQELDDEDNG
jgi:hypothetical protein